MNGLSFPVALSGHNFTAAKEYVGGAPGMDIWHSGPITDFLLAILILVVAGESGKHVARALKFPVVLGELLMGILLANVYFFSGWGFFELLQTTPSLKIPADFGTIILLLSVGLHTDLNKMLRAGSSSFLVALGGVIAPAGLGYLVAYFLLPDASFSTHIFLAITLSATSVGLTVRVFEELGKLQSNEARIIIGAAIIDDILVLIVLGIFSGMMLTGSLAVHSLAISGGMAVGFVGVVTVIALKLSKPFGNVVTRKFSEPMKVFLVVVICLLLAYLAESIGLATIVGSFGAGLLLRHIHMKDPDGDVHGLEEIVRPAYMVFVPIFFVYVGTQVRLESFLNWHSILIGFSITGAAILGKLFCSLCVVEKGVNRLAIGIGMIPRAEVTVTLAGIGITLGVLSEDLFSAIIMMVAIVAVMAPLLLKFVLRERSYAKVAMEAERPRSKA
ncbi:MAG: cation:proton antiporter [Candidatus Brocadiales bacterium]|nr:cation:proton antiporter [Candidatus Bathyanammoxibius amoris]